MPLSKRVDNGIWKKEAIGRTFYGTLFGTGCGPTVRHSTQWTNWTEIDSHAETCSGIVRDVLLNILLSKITLLIHQDSHRRTHVCVVTSVFKYSPERNKRMNHYRTPLGELQGRYTVYTLKSGVHCIRPKFILTLFQAGRLSQRAAPSKRTFCCNSIITPTTAHI